MSTVWRRPPAPRAGHGWAAGLRGTSSARCSCSSTAARAPPRVCDLTGQQRRLATRPGAHVQPGGVADRRVGPRPAPAPPPGCPRPVRPPHPSPPRAARRGSPSTRTGGGSYRHGRASPRRVSLFHQLRRGPVVRLTSVTAPAVLSASSSAAVSAHVRSGFEARQRIVQPTRRSTPDVTWRPTDGPPGRTRAWVTTQRRRGDPASPRPSHRAPPCAARRWRTRAAPLFTVWPSQFHGLGDRSMITDPHVLQLVDAQAQGVEQLGLERVERAIHALGQDRVMAPLPAQGAVAELGGEPSVAAGELMVGQDPGPGDVGVGAVELHGPEQVQGREPRRIHPTGRRSRRGSRGPAGAGATPRASAPVVVSQGARPAPRGRRGPSRRPA